MVFIILGAVIGFLIPFLDKDLDLSYQVLFGIFTGTVLSGTGFLISVILFSIHCGAFTCH